jgi:hypothetical protein
VTVWVMMERDGDERAEWDSVTVAFTEAAAKDQAQQEADARDEENDRRPHPLVWLKSGGKAVYANHGQHNQHTFLVYETEVKS